MRLHAWHMLRARTEATRRVAAFSSALQKCRVWWLSVSERREGQMCLSAQIWANPHHLTEALPVLALCSVAALEWIQKAGRAEHSFILFANSYLSLETLCVGRTPQNDGDSTVNPTLTIKLNPPTPLQWKSLPSQHSSAAAGL